MTDSNGYKEVPQTNYDRQNQDEYYNGTDMPRSPKELRRAKWRIIKNISCISLAFLFLFSAVLSMAMLQSSLNSEGGLGVIGLSCNFGTVLVSCLILPSIIINLIGCKWTMFGGIIGFTIWMSANMYPKWETIIPASFIMGVAWAPLWTAQCTYFTANGLQYARLTGEKDDAIITRFFGIFFMMFQSGPIWGNLVSSSVLSMGKVNTMENDTIAAPKDDSHLAFCGAGNCPNSGGIMQAFPPISMSNFANDTINVTTNISGITHAPEPEPDMGGVLDMHLVRILVAIDMAFGVIGCLIIAFFVDRMKKHTGADENKFSIKLISATVRHMVSKKQLLLIPLTMYTGMEQTFMIAEYTAAFTACALGIWMVGYTVMCFGVVGAIVSFSSGAIAKKTGRLPIFILGAVTHFGLLITFLFWKPHPDQVYLFFIFPALWGLGDSIWQTQINALYGCIFTKDSEAAFSNYRLWESVGMIAGYGYSSFLCVNVKIFIVMSALAIGMCGYLLVEWINKLDENAKELQKKSSVEMQDSHKLRYDIVRPSDSVEDIWQYNDKVNM